MPWEKEAAALDDLEGHEEECLEDFKRDLDAAFWEEWEAAMLPTDAQIESWTMRTAEENMRVAGEVLHSVAEDRLFSIPDKLYAQTRAEGYEAGMADAALIAGRYLDGADAAVVRGLLTNVVLRANALEHVK